MGSGWGPGPGMLCFWFWPEVQARCCAKGRGWGLGLGRLTQTGCGSSIGRVPSLAATAEGAEAVDALTAGAQVSEHAALVHIWGTRRAPLRWPPRVTGAHLHPCVHQPSPWGRASLYFPSLTPESPPLDRESYLCQQDTLMKLLPLHTENTWRGDTPSPQPHQGTHTHTWKHRQIHTHCTPVTLTFP